jgi:hypothetical protein
MLRLLQAGLVAAGRQLVAVLVIILLASLLTSHNFAVQDASAMSSGTEGSLISLSQLLIWAYLLLAVGFALTSGRWIGLTAKRIHHASRLMRFVPSGHASRSLVALFGIGAVVFAIFALRAPPELLIEGTDTLAVPVLLRSHGPA